MSEKFIKNILDVPGVEGVCLFDSEGRLLSNHLPEFFIVDLFEDLARRVISLYETVDENFVPCDDYLLKYSERWLFLRRGNGIFLLALTSSAVNRVSLKMVTNLAIKNLSPKSFGDVAPPAPAPAAVLPAATTAPAPAPTVAPTPPVAPAPPEEVADEPTPSPENEESPLGRKRVPRPRPSRSFRGSSY